jgi:replicative DNA helicase
MDLMIVLENSRSFANTHTVIKELKEYENWTQDELVTLMDIAVNNSQIFYILHDIDVKLFYRKLLKQMKNISENGRKVNEVIDDEE